LALQYGSQTRVPVPIPPSVRNLQTVVTEPWFKVLNKWIGPGGSIGYVGVPHGMKLDMWPVFFTLVHLHGGPAPVRRYLPNLIKLVWEPKINPGKVFYLALPLEQVAEGYRAMDDRRAIKTLLKP